MSRAKEQKQDNGQYGCDIGNYINGNYSICREERQYAVFLYNILRKYSVPDSRKGCQDVKNIFKACNLPSDAVIEYVFYEATFMRDFFERNRIYALRGDDKVIDAILSHIKFKRDDCILKEAKKSFNYKLVQYVNKWWKDEDKDEEAKLDCPIEEINLGRNSIKSNKIKSVKEGLELSHTKKNRIKVKIQKMMNATPDIAVIYHSEKTKEKRALMFLECKFESKEAYYKCEAEGELEEKRYAQREVQWRIADFLCKNYLDMDISKNMKDGKSWLVKFVRKGEKISRGEILIKNLIEVEEKIFK